MDEAKVYGKFMILCVQNDLVIVISPLQFNKIFKFAVKRCFPITLNHRQRQAIDKVGLNLTVCSFIYLLFTFFHRYYPIRYDPFITCFSCVDISEPPQCDERFSFRYLSELAGGDCENSFLKFKVWLIQSCGSFENYFGLFENVSDCWRSPLLW